MPKLSIITPTFNRGKLLERLYLSLESQTNKNFDWIVVDDGSTDDTESIISKFKPGDFDILYLKKNNGGKHTALNFAIERCSSDVCLIVDSDDMLLPAAVDFFISQWDIYYSDKDVAAISALCIDSSGTVVGDLFPKNGMKVKHYELVLNLNIHGDRIEAYKKSVLLKYPFPEYPAEKFVTEAVVWNRISESFQKICFNEPLLIHEYYNDGLTVKLKRLYAESPQGSSLYFNELSQLDISIAKRLKFRSIYYKYNFYQGSYSIDNIMDIPLYIMGFILMLKEKIM